jgi:hypothetical protein
LMAVPTGATLIKIPKGTPAIFSPTLLTPQIFRPGDVAGDIQTSSGSITVQQSEGPQI